MSQPDITILPTNPCSASWTLRANTNAGLAFLEQHHPPHAFPDGRISTLKLAVIRLKADDSLTFKTDWSCHVRTIVE